MSGRETNLTKNNSTDRVLTLKPVEGKTVTDTSGKIDQRLFNGENRLHAIRDAEYGLWTLQLEHGSLSQALNQKWTSFPKLFEAAKAYFLKRNVEISEIIE